MTFSAYVQNYPEGSMAMARDRSSEGTVAIAQDLTPTWVEIIEDENGASLFQYCSDGGYIADSWHENLEEAKRQAEQEFGIREEHWFGE